MVTEVKSWCKTVTCCGSCGRARFLEPPPLDRGELPRDKERGSLIGSPYCDAWRPMLAAPLLLVEYCDDVACGVWWCEPWRCASFISCFYKIKKLNIGKTEQCLFSKAGSEHTYFTLYTDSYYALFEFVMWIMDFMKYFFI